MKKICILFIMGLAVMLSGASAGSAVLSVKVKQNTFEFNYDNNYETEAVSLSEKLPRIIDALSDFYGDRFKLNNKIAVRIKNDKNKSAGKNYPLPSGMENIVLSSAAFYENFDPAAVLAHELSHSVIKNNYSGFAGLFNPILKWLDEGIACQFNMKTDMWTDRNLKEILRGYPELPAGAGFLYNNGVFEKYGDTDRYASRKIYCLSAGIVKLIMDKIGKENFFTFLDEVSKNRDMRKLLEKHTGETGEDLYSEYLRSLDIGRVVLERSE